MVVSSTELERRTGVPREFWEAMMQEQALAEDTAGLPEQGTPISIKAAANRYGLNRPTLNRWVIRGIIHVLQYAERPGDPVLVDEREVAHYARAYQKNPGRGRWTVNREAEQRAAATLG